MAVLLATAWFALAERGATGALRGLPLDDSYIHLELAHHLASGDGLSFDGARLVPASTSPLWTALVAVLFVLPIDPIVAVKLLGVALLFVVAEQVRRIAGAIGFAPGWAALAGVLCVTAEGLVWSALSGMEVLLLCVLTLAGVLAVMRERASGRGVLSLLWFSLASLARPEALLLLIAAVAGRLIRVAGGAEPASRDFEANPVQSPLMPPSSSLSPSFGLELNPAAWRSRELLSGLAAAVVVVGSVGLLFWATSGSALPTTFSVKGALHRRGYPALRDLWMCAEILYRQLPLPTLLALGGALVVIYRRVGERTGTVLLVWWPLMLPIAYSALADPQGRFNPGNFGRYLFPLLPFVVLLGLSALLPLIERWPRGLRLMGVRLGWWPLGLLLLLPTLHVTRSSAARYALNVRNVAQSDVAAGRWIAKNLEPSAVLALQDIGAIGYLTPNPIVDLVGLVNPEIQPYVRGNLRGRHPSGLQGLFDYMRAHDTTHVVLFPRSYGGLETLRVAASECCGLSLDIVVRFAVEQNVTMAGDELVVLRLSADSVSKGAPLPESPEGRPGG